MKTDLKLKGSVQLNRHEISESIVEYLKKHHDYEVVKVIYPGNTEINIVVEVTGSTHNAKIPKYGEIEKYQERDNPGGHKKRNIGVFETVRTLLNDSFKAKKPIVAFDDLVRDVVYFHPGMNAKKLAIYLLDKRQLGTNFTFVNKRKGIKEIHIKGEMMARKKKK